MIGLFGSILVFCILPQGAFLFVFIIIGRAFLVTGMRLVASSRGLLLVAERVGTTKAVAQVAAIGLFLLWL
jgi:phosphatidylglycerophosphate synthase